MMIICQTESGMPIGYWDVDINSASELDDLYEFIDSAIKAYENDKEE